MPEPTNCHRCGRPHGQSHTIGCRYYQFPMPEPNMTYDAALSREETNDE